MSGKANSNHWDWQTQNKEANNYAEGTQRPATPSWPREDMGNLEYNSPHGLMQSDPFPKGDIGVWSTQPCCFTRMSSMWGSVHVLSRYAFCFSFYFSKVCEFY